MVRGDCVGGRLACAEGERVRCAERKRQRPWRATIFVRSQNFTGGR